MPANLVDVDAFTSPVVVPVDGDAENAASVIQGFQPLANRTLNLKNRIDKTFATYGQWDVGSGSSVGASGSKYELATVGITGDMTMASNEVTLVSAGLYIVHYSVSLGTLLVANPANPGIEVFLDAVSLGATKTYRLSADPTHLVRVSQSILIGATAGQKLSLKSTANTCFAAPTEGSRLVIVRMS